MGKKSDELRREITEYRQQLDARANRLEERVRNDVRDSRETADQDLRERLHIDKYAEERPFLTLAVAFGAGMVLGAVTPNPPMPSMGKSKNGGQSQSSSSSNSGMLSSLLGTATGSLSSTLSDEVRELFRQATGERNSAGSSASSESSGSTGAHAMRMDGENDPNMDRHEAAESAEAGEEPSKKERAKG